MSLSQFKDLGDDVWLYEPRDNEEDNGKSSLVQGAKRTRQNGRGHPPALIILCTWLGGATTKRIERYTKGYHGLWPQSSILLIRTNIGEYLVRSTTSLRRKLRPAHREIRRLGLVIQHEDKASSVPQDGKILLHIFSQGGGSIAMQLVESTNAILATLGYEGPLPLRQIVLDSCPGNPDIHSTYEAAAHSLPDVSLLRPLGCVVMYILAVGLVGMEAIGLRAPRAKMMHSQLNDPDIFSAKAARLYLTSEADKIVDSRDVEEHRNEAVAKGMTTDILRFHRAGHCSLVLENEAAYWNAIASGWEKSAIPEDTQSVGHFEDSGSLCPPCISPATSNQSRSRL